MWKLLRDIGVDCFFPTPLHCDNQRAIKIAANSVFHERTTNSIFHERTKDIEIDCYFTQHYYSKTKIITYHISLTFADYGFLYKDSYLKMSLVFTFQILRG